MADPVHRRAADPLAPPDAAPAALPASRDDVLATLTYEVRSSMNVIVGLTELALRDELREPARRQLERAIAAAHLLLGNVGDIVDVERARRGHLRIEQAEFDPAQVLQEVIDAALPDAQDRDIALTALPTAAPGRQLLGDAARLRQLLLHLVRAALRAALLGEVRVAATLHPAAGETARLQIAIEGADAASLGQPATGFGQAETATGLPCTDAGLLIGRQLANLLGGEVGCAPAADGTVTLAVTLPLRLAPARTPATSQAAAADAQPRASSADEAVAFYRRRFAGRRVLLAEDNEVGVELAVTFLEAVGLDVVVARDGQQVLELLAQRPVDCVLMDCQMPRMDGLTAARRLRAMAATRQLPIVALTAHALSDEREAVFAAGMDDHLPKPIEMERLYATLLRWLPGASAPRPGPLSVAAAPAVPGLPALPGLDLTRALGRVQGNVALFKRLLRLFARQHDRFVLEYGDAVRRGAGADAVELLHTLRGAASTLSFQVVVDAALELEGAIQAGTDVALLAPVSDRMLAAMHELRPVLDGV